MSGNKPSSVVHVRIDFGTVISPLISLTVITFIFHFRGAINIIIIQVTETRPAAACIGQLDTRPIEVLLC